MKKLSSSERRKELQALAALPDIEIDTSDIPELTDQELKEMVRGGLYRPLKQPVTIRLDSDVIAWLKQDGRGYQTKANALLRREMLRAAAEKKRPAPAVQPSSKRKRSR